MSAAPRVARSDAEAMMPPLPEIRVGLPPLGVAAVSSGRRGQVGRAVGLLGLAGALFVLRSAIDAPGWISVGLAVGVSASLLCALAASGRAVRGPRWDATFWLSVLWLVLLGGSAVLAGALPLRDPAKPDFAHVDQRPQFQVHEPLGTDDLGRSVLSRSVYGARITLTASFAAVLIGATIGGAAGLLAGYFRGPLDSAASLLGDVMLSFPPLILLMGMVTVMPRNAVTIAIGLGVLTVPAFFRVARASSMSLAQSEFIVAARAMGATRRRVLLRDLLPNVLAPLLAYLFVVLALLIVAEGSLSYLGVGIQPPTPTWGRMIADGQAEFGTAPHKVLVPSLLMFATLFALNTVGDRIRGARSKESVL